jgi:AraC-like DNA-binding protein
MVLQCGRKQARLSDNNPMPMRTHKVADLPTLKERLWPNMEFPSASSPQSAPLLSLLPPGRVLGSGSLYRDGMHVDLQWHFHDMHKLLYAFEGAIEVESIRGRNLIPRQLAAWIPAGVPHCTSIHGIRWVSVFFTTEMVADPEQRVRTIMVSALMREMMREAMRWPLGGLDCAVRTAFYDAMGKLCGEWIAREANLFLPTSKDARVKRALDYTVQRMDLNLAAVCQHVGISVRSLRRHLKAETGTTWDDYRHRSRLLQAISLLSETDEPVSEIAARCGFDSPSAFARVFRREMGEPPRDYRDRVMGAAHDEPIPRGRA